MRAGAKRFRIASVFTGRPSMFDPRRQTVKLATRTSMQMSVDTCAGWHHSVTSLSHGHTGGPETAPADEISSRIQPES